DALADARGLFLHGLLLLAGHRWGGRLGADWDRRRPGWLLSLPHRLHLRCAPRGVGGPRSAAGDGRAAHVPALNRDDPHGWPRFEAPDVTSPTPDVTRQTGRAKSHPMARRLRPIGTRGQTPE